MKKRFLKVVLFFPMMIVLTLSVFTMPICYIIWDDSHKFHDKVMSWFDY